MTARPCRACLQQVSCPASCALVQDKCAPVALVQEHVEHDAHETHHHVGSDQSNHHTGLDGAAELARGHVGNAKGLGHRGISSRESVGVAGLAGQVAARVTPKLATDDARARRQSSLRLLRLREAAGVTQEEIGRRVGVTKRAVGSIERAEVRAVALHAFLLLLDEVIEKKGLDVALAAILSSSHMAVEAATAVDRAAAKPGSNPAEGSISTPLGKAA